MGQAQGWSLENVGAANDAERTYVYLLDERAVRVAVVDEEGHTVLRAIPSAVLVHLLRAQGYEVQEAG